MHTFAQLGTNHLLSTYYVPGVVLYADVLQENSFPIKKYKRHANNKACGYLQIILDSISYLKKLPYNEHDYSHIIDIKTKAQEEELLWPRKPHQRSRNQNRDA